MHKLASLVLIASLSGCIVVTEDDHGSRHFTPPPPPPQEPAVRHLDCGWLASWNCWDAAVAEVAACAPDTWNAPYAGIYGDYGHGCYFADGSAVFFEEAVTVPLSRFHRWSFSMEDPYGGTCGWFVESDTGVSLGTASGVVDVVVDAGGISVICQDGTEWYNRNPHVLDNCAGADWNAPGYWRESFSGGSSFGLLGGGDQPPLWSCVW